MFGGALGRFLGGPLRASWGSLWEAPGGPPWRPLGWTKNQAGQKIDGRLCPPASVQKLLAK